MKISKSITPEEEIEQALESLIRQTIRYRTPLGFTTITLSQKNHKLLENAGYELRTKMIDGDVRKIYELR